MVKPRHTRSYMIPVPPPTWHFIPSILLQLSAASQRQVVSHRSFSISQSAIEGEIHDDDDDEEEVEEEEVEEEEEEEESAGPPDHASGPHPTLLQVLRNRGLIGMS
ncbi:hypothetical protein EmuJ_000494000 [Echinococcus multilocularis]|uniref:Uncharacterized protein n=1 Tax=Echinococcus multilocularis TaxID=6211 RepID=A0A068XZL4_ECHMU|nr:hypothetical protein EmuJ_000494000 [Echinococcus multilocularis]